MRIAICDDNKKELAEIASYINQYKSEKGLSFSTHIFTNPTELLVSMVEDTYDILFLDMLMPGINGIETAKEIRGYNKNLPIVFITSTEEYAAKSYGVKAFSYLLKPIETGSEIFTVLDEILQKNDALLKSIYIKTTEGVASLLFSEIVYIEVVRKKLYFHTADGGVKKSISTLQAIEQEFLKYPQFIKISRSHIINSFKMKELKKDSFITDTGNVIPIAASSYKEVKSAFEKNIFLDRGE